MIAAVVSLALFAALPSVELLEDPHGALTASEVWSSPAFTPIAPAGVNLGYSASTYWLRLRLPGCGSCVLDMTAALDSVELYEAPDAPPRRSGRALPPERRDLPGVRLAFRLQLAPGQDRQVILAIHSHDTVILEPRLVPETAFWTGLVRERAAHGVYYGILLSLVAYNLFLFLATRERAYLAYSAFQAAFAVNQATIDHYTAELVWPSHPDFAVRWDQAAAPLTCLTALVFARMFLRTTGRLDRAMQCLVAISVVLVAIAALTVHSDARKWATALHVLLALGTITAAAVLAMLRARSLDATVFAIGWSVMIAACFLATLSAVGAIRSVQGFPLMKVGSASEAILLSLALAGRIHGLRREREVAQREVLRSRLARAEALSTLVSGVAHEIGNPLNFARGGAEEVSRQLALGEVAAARRAAQLAVSGMQRIERIVANLRAYLRAGDVDEVLHDVGAEIAAAVALVSASAPSVEIECRLAELPLLRARPGEIHQVLVNLVTNAVQAMPRGGTLVIAAAARGSRLDIAVEDTGPGVEPSRREAIFEPFFTTRGSEGGTGLGLAVAREIVHRHGGTLRVEDGAVGARFVVDLPLR